MMDPKYKTGPDPEPDVSIPFHIIFLWICMVIAMLTILDLTRDVEELKAVIERQAVDGS